MSRRPFQFSMARLFVVVTLFCCAAWSIRIFWASGLVSIPGCIAALVTVAIIDFMFGRFMGTMPITGAFLNNFDELPFDPDESQRWRITKMIIWLSVVLALTVLAALIELWFPGSGL